MPTGTLGMVMMVVKVCWYVYIYIYDSSYVSVFLGPLFTSISCNPNRFSVFLGSSMSIHDHFICHQIQKGMLNPMD